MRAERKPNGSRAEAERKPSGCASKRFCDLKVKKTARPPRLFRRGADSTRNVSGQSRVNRAVYHVPVQVCPDTRWATHAASDIARTNRTRREQPELGEGANGKID